MHAKYSAKPFKSLAKTALLQIDSYSCDYGLYTKMYSNHMGLPFGRKEILTFVYSL